MTNGLSLKDALVLLAAQDADLAKQLRELTFTLAGQMREKPDFTTFNEVVAAAREVVPQLDRILSTTEGEKKHLLRLFDAYMRGN